MAHIHTPKMWDVNRHDATPESVFRSRRKFLKTTGLAGLAGFEAPYGWPTETMIGTNKVYETQLYNGYGQYVARLYTGDEH